jgi:tRNA (cytidine/uridine-2'-O-)-methyltransferase
MTTKSKNSCFDVSFRAGDYFLFGPETRGLPDELLTSFEPLRIPMLEHSRSLNLANAVSIVIYEAWRQCQFVNA